jgi:thioredoxin 1
MILKPATFDEFTNLLNTYRICVVDFYGDWCGPCKTLGEKMESTFGDSRICVIKLDLGNQDEFGDFASKCGVGGIPHVIFFIDGKVQSDIVLGDDIDSIVANTNRLVAAIAKT